MPKKNPDLLKVSVTIDAEVSEAEWRRACYARGIDLTGVVPDSHLAQTIKAIAYNGLAAAGFPQTVPGAVRVGA